MQAQHKALKSVGCRLGGWCGGRRRGSAALAPCVTLRAAAGFRRRCVSADEGRSPSCSHWRRCCMLASASSAATSAASCWRRCSRPSCIVAVLVLLVQLLHYTAGWAAASAVCNRGLLPARRLNQGHQAIKFVASAGALATAAATSRWNRWAGAAATAICRHSRLTVLWGCRWGWLAGGPA